MNSSDDESDSWHTLEIEGISRFLNRKTTRITRPGLPMPDLPIKEDESRVLQTYEQLAVEVIDSGYRHNPIYLARKAIVDWDLMMAAGIHGKRVLNVGCFEPIDELIWASAAKEWIAIDLSPQAIDTAKTLVRLNLHPSIVDRVQFHVMDAQHIDYPDESFDITVSFSVIDHIPDPEVRKRVVREMARVTRKGGHVVITVPNRYSYFHVMHRRNVRKKIVTHVGFQYFYSYQELKREIESVGLKTVRFTSDMKNVGDLPKFARAMLLPFLRFGDRMGFLAEKQP